MVSQLVLIIVMFSSFMIVNVRGQFVEDQGVLVLSKNDFELARSTFDNLFVEFYSPWCGHCKFMAPEIVKATQILAEKGTNARIAKVDAEVEAALKEEYQITKYPTFKLFMKEKNKVLDYSSGRHANDIVSFLEKKLGSPAKEINSVEEANNFISQNDFLIFAFLQDEGLKSLFDQVAFDNDKYTFAVTSDLNLFGEFKIIEDTIVAFKKFDEGRAELKGDITYESINQFILNHHLPIVNEFSEENADKIFSTGINLYAILFVNKLSDGFKDYLGNLHEAARDFRGKIISLYVDINEEDNMKVLEFFGVPLEECPTIRIVDLTSVSEPLKYNPTKSDLTKSSICDFIDDVIKGKARPFFKSENVPANWDSNPVKVLVGKNFHQVIDSALNSKSILVLFYAPWCGHCKKLEPIWDLLGEKYQHSSDVMIAKMDSTINELPKLNIQSFPTIKLFVKGSTTVVDYSGERTLEALVKFVDSDGQVMQVPKYDEPRGFSKEEL